MKNRHDGLRLLAFFLIWTAGLVMFACRNPTLTDWAFFFGATAFGYDVGVWIADNHSRMKSLRDQLRESGHSVPGEDDEQ